MIENRPYSGIDIQSRKNIPEAVVQMVNYKSEVEAIQCLDTFIQTNDGQINYAINIADNASGDTLEQIERKFKDKVRVYRFDKNYGFGTAHNLLAEESKQIPHIFILNPDTIFEEQNVLLSLLSRVPEHSVVGPKLITTEKERQMWDHGDFILPGIDIYLLYRWVQHNTPTVVPWVSGAAFLITRQAFEKVGGFDPNIFLYFEELRLCHDLRQFGDTVLYDPTVTVKHIGSVSTGEDKLEYFKASRKYVLNEHYPPLAARTLELIASLTDRSLKPSVSSDSEKHPDSIGNTGSQAAQNE